jgi:nicotinamidase-related amidase
MSTKPRTKAPDLLGKGTALLLIDFINDFCFPDAKALFRPALRAAGQTAVLKGRAKAAGIPVIYVNDNYGFWTHNFEDVMSHCQRTSRQGGEVMALLRPLADDYVVLKPKNSGFFETPLATLLRQLAIKRLILTGLAADNCVLFTANDAHLHEFELVIPPDCVAAESRAATRRALLYVRRHLEAALTVSTSIRFRPIKTRGARKAR